MDFFTSNRVLVVGALAGGALFTQPNRDDDGRGHSVDGAGASPTGLFVRASAAFFLAELTLRFIWFAFIYPHYFSPMRHLPTAGDAHWLWGHMPMIMRLTTGDPMREWMRTLPNDGIIRYFGPFHSERLFLLSPKALAEVLVTNAYAYKKPDTATSGLGRLFGTDGILLVEGEEHKRQRRNLNPAFAFRHIKDLYPIFWEKSRQVVQAMTAACGSEGFMEADFDNWSSRVTLDILGVAGINNDFHAVQDENNELVQTYKHLFKTSGPDKLLTMLTFVFPGWMVNAIPIKRNREIQTAVQSLRGVSLKLIHEKQQKLVNKDKDVDVDILSVALKSGQFTEESLVSQMMTFLAAGHETTAKAVTWAIYSLCLYPEMQRRLREEIRERLPSTSSEAGISSQDIDRMPLLNAFCNETLRYWSVVPMTMREAAQDTTIQGQHVRKGTRIAICAWAINQSTDLWGADATTFNPERWIAGGGGDEATLEEKQRAASGGASSNYAFMTFLHGPRSCIGSGFARAEMACLVAAWVGRFSFELVDERLLDERNMKFKSGVTVRPKDGLFVKVRVLDEY